MEKEKLYNFLISDLEKLKKDTQEIIQYVYNSNYDKEIGGYKENIENIDNFFSYWKQHINKLK